MLPATWIEHRREDRETVGWIVPDGENFRAYDLLGWQVTAEPVDWLAAEELLELRGIGYLADRYQLTLPDGTVRPVRIAELSIHGIGLIADEYGSASAAGQSHETFRVEFPAPATLRPEKRP